MGTAGSVLEPLPFNSNDFPKHGVRLSFLQEFIEDCGGRDALQSLNTTDVCEQFVKPKTRTAQSSYCDLLQHIEHPAVGAAQVFISHAWKYTFLDVADALVDHFRDEAGIVIWFDLFSNNQHKAVDLNFEYWATTFQSAIKAFGRTVMVFAPWNNPIPLARAWCLWELYCTVHVQSKFEVAMTTSATEKFIKDVIYDAVGEIYKMLGTIDVKKSESFNPDDKVRIHKAVIASVGFEALNTMVFEQLRGWVIETLQKSVDKASTELKKQELLQALGSMYFSQGKYELAQSLYEGSYKAYLKEYGERREETLGAMQTLANNYYVLHDFNKAETLYKKCLTLRKEVNGEKHTYTLILARALASVYNCQEKFDLAVPLLLECLASDKELYGEKNEKCSGTLLYLGTAYQFQGMYDEAEQYLDECLKLRMEALGPRHPDTLDALALIATLYLNQNQIPKALQIFTECFHLRKEVLGEKHVDTMITMSKVAAALKAAQRFDESEAMFLECIKLRKNTLGDKHPETLSTMSELALLYNDQNKSDQALTIAVETLEILTSSLGEKDPATLRVMSDLGYIYGSQEKWDNSAQLLEKCYRLRVEVLGLTHSDSTYTKSILQYVYYNQGRSVDFD